MKRLLSLFISALILAVIYWKIDARGLLQVFQSCNPLWMAISLAMVVPLTLLTAWRLQQLVPTQTRQATTQKSLGSSALTWTEANRLILAASVLNMVLPSKMGDIAKAYFMRDRGHLSGSLALSLVVFEKACDMLSLLLWCAFGLAIYPHHDGLFGVMTLSVVAGLGLGTLLLSSAPFARFCFTLGQRIAPQSMQTKLGKLRYAWQDMHDYFWQDRRHLGLIAVTSVVIWFLHLLQIWFFILALNAYAPFLASLALSPLAILAGLLPLTFAGVGTRDAALIAFYQPYFAAPTAAALGLLCTSRYILPALGGLPFLGQYLAMIKQERLARTAAPIESQTDGAQRTPPAE